jgi:hypothetical protein
MIPKYEGCAPRKDALLNAKLCLQLVQLGFSVCKRFPSRSFLAAAAETLLLFVLLLFLLIFLIVVIVILFRRVLI